MPTYSKSLVILILFAVFWLENKAHHCGSPHEKTHKKLEKGKTSTTATTPAPAPTPAKPIKVNFKCNTGTVPSCKCGISTAAIDDSYYYQVPKSGNCKDVFKRLSTTPSDYHFREENCSKVQRAVCSVNSYCEDSTFIPDERIGTPPPTPDEFVIRQNTSKPFCKCGYDYIKNNGHYRIPKSGNCIDLETLPENQSAGLSCYKAITLCRDNCYCNNHYVDPTKCDPQTCNNASEAFCKCGIADVHYPVPGSGNYTDLIKHSTTKPSYYYRFGYHCYKARTVCQCRTFPSTHCECKEECEGGMRCV